MTFIAFIFTVVVWLPNGSPEQPIIRLEPNLESCQADAVAFAQDAEVVNQQNTPPMRITYHIDCRPVMNGSEAKSA